MTRIFLLLLCSLLLLVVKSKANQEDDYKRPLHEDPLLVTLTDETFEHETQASTGQTTGSWLVWFHTTTSSNTVFTGDVPDSTFWEENHVVLASIDVEGNDGKVTLERFHPKHIPSFILIHKGKMYRYDQSTTTSSSSGYNWDSISKFVQNPEKYAVAENVPLPPIVMTRVIQLLDGNSNILIGAIVCSIILGMVLFTALMGQSTKKEKNT